MARIILQGLLATFWLLVYGRGYCIPTPARQLQEMYLPRLLTEEEEHWAGAVIAQAQRNPWAAAAAHRILVQHNMRLVSYIVNDLCRHRRRQREELMAEGVLGLSQAAEKYTGQARFSKYAYHFIRSRIMRAMSKLGGASHRDILLYGRIRRAKFSLAEKHGRAATLRETAAAVGVTESTVQEVVRRRQMQRWQPLDAESAVSNSYRNIMQENGLQWALHHAKGLSAFDKRVFAMRVGLYDGKEKSVARVAELMCTSEETVRQSLLITATTLRPMIGAGRM